ncbi:hypothetical protein D3C73_1515160 [compost metagenome]
MLIQRPCEALQPVGPLKIVRFEETGDFTVSQRDQMLCRHITTGFIIELQAGAMKFRVPLINHNEWNAVNFQRQVQRQIRVALGAFGRLDNQALERLA